VWIPFHLGRPPSSRFLNSYERIFASVPDGLLVVDEGQLRGVISLKDVSRLVSLKLELED